MTISQFPIPAGGIPTGDTAGRPANPVIGDVYYNGELGILEIFDGTDFIACSAPPASPTVASAVDVGTSRAFGSAQATVTLTPAIGGGVATQFSAVGTLNETNFESATTTSTTVTLTVGNSGTYSISGKAINNFGISVTGPTTSVALTTVPQAPTIGTATTSSVTSDVTVTWTLGANGGKNLSAITVTPFLNGTTAETATTAATTSSTSATIVGLTGGSAYTFKVKATNANGDGADSAATGSVTVPVIVTIDFLVIAGGGGGGSGGGGGGGAGGLRSTVTATGGGGSLESALTRTKGTNYTVTVGAGGAGGAAGSYNKGANGSNSVFSTITSIGGGGGGALSSETPATGGSGGGGGNDTVPSNGAAGTANQGFRGGNGSANAQYASSGGGGAGAQGVDGTNQPTNGGAGVAVSITGSSVTYAGGGGGGSQSGYNVLPTTGFGSGGSGGGGNGSTSATGSAGTVNLGGGGGGGGYPSGVSTGEAGGAGGSGVVILRYLTADGTITVGAGLTEAGSGTDGSYSYKRFTAGTGNVSWS